MIECKSLTGCPWGKESGGIIFSFVIPELSKRGFQCDVCNKVWWVDNLEEVVIKDYCKDPHKFSVRTSYHLHLTGKLIIGKSESEEYHSGLYKFIYRGVINDPEYYKLFWERIRKSEARTNRILYREGLPPVKPLEEENN
jgi:hypothetical protein